MGILYYAFAWFLFAAVHSSLARPTVQITIESYLTHWYRLSYNLLAVLTILMVLFTGTKWISTSTLSVFDDSVLWFVSYGIMLIGYIVFIAAFTSYDMGRFVGITQIINRERVSTASSESLLQEGLNRWARHPLYTGAFLILWGGAHSWFDIWTAFWGTLYLLIGTKYEERKLIKIYGDEYRNYQKHVPRYFPTPKMNRNIKSN